jgi:hypothetical protein
MLRRILIGVVLGLLLIGCGAGQKLMFDELGMLHAQNEDLKKQADVYAKIIAENQLALGKLIEEHHMLSDHAITDICTPRPF